MLVHVGGFLLVCSKRKTEIFFPFLQKHWAQTEKTKNAKRNLCFGYDEDAWREALVCEVVARLSSVLSKQEVLICAEGGTWSRGAKFFVSLALTKI